MELGRRLGILPHKALIDSISEKVEIDFKNLREAFLGKSLFHQDIYALQLQLRQEPAKKIYAFLVADSNRVSIEIPLTDHTPEEELIQQAYETSTFFGELVPEKFRNFATKEFTREPIVALLNRKEAGVSSDEVSNWFHNTFNLDHQKSYGSVSIGSYGGQGYYGIFHTATVESISNPLENKPQTAIDFARKAQRSLPNININFLPVENFLQNVQSKLKFLPKDWELYAS